MWKAKCVAVLLLAPSLYCAPHVYTFWSEGDLQVFVPHPESFRSIGFSLYTYPGDSFVLSAVTNSSTPYTIPSDGYLAPGAYRLEAPEEVDVIAGEPRETACPSLFVRPTPGSGSGSILYTGSPGCTSRRAFLFSPTAGATFILAPGNLLDPCTESLPGGGYWKEVSTTAHSPLCHVRTTAESGTLQVYPAAASAGFFVPNLSTNEWFFFIHGYHLPPMLPRPVAVHVTASEQGASLFIRRFLDKSTEEVVWEGELEAGATHTQTFTSQEKVHIQSTHPLAVMVLPGNETDWYDFNQFAPPLDARSAGEPGFGRSFRVPLWAHEGYIRLWGGADPLSVDIYDSENEFVDTVSFTRVLTIDRGDLPGGWYVLSSRDGEFGVQVGAETKGHTYVPENPVAEVIERPLEIFGLHASPPYPRVRDAFLRVTCVTNWAARSELFWRREGGVPSTIAGPSTAAVAHSFAIPLSSFLPGEQGSFRVRAWVPGSTRDTQTDWIGFRIQWGEPDLVHVASRLDRNGSVWEVESQFRNDGEETAVAPAVTYTLREFLPVAESTDTAWESMTVQSDDSFVYLARDGGSVTPGGTVTMRTTLLPAVDWQSGSTEVKVEGIAYTDRAANSYDAILTVGLAPPYHEINEIVENADFVTLTCPQRLYSTFATDTDTALLLITAADHARRRNGIVALSRPDRDRGETHRWVKDRCGDRLSSDWKRGGHLMILGEENVIPGKYWISTWLHWDDGSWMRVRNHDQYWSDTDGNDHYKPELAVGRVIGNTAAAMIGILQNAFTPSANNRALVMSGTGKQAREKIRPAAHTFRNRIEDEYTDITTLDQTNGDATDEELLDWLRLEGPNLNLIGGFFHGSPTSWTAMSATHLLAIPQPNLALHPIVYSCACLTGKYWISDTNFTEAFLDLGAAGMIAATAPTPLSKGGDFSYSVGKYIDEPDLTLGYAFRRAKRHFFTHHKSWYELSQCISYAMNYYGDPARPVATPPKRLEARKADPPVLDTPDVTIQVPEVRIEDHGDFHEVHFSDGGRLGEIDRPMVPVYSQTFLLTKNERVRAVTLAEPTGREEGSGLLLQACDARWDDSGPPGPVFCDYDDFWPQAEKPAFSWSVSPVITEGGELAQEFVLVVYPFNYKPTTTAWYCYHTYVFSVDVVDSPIFIHEVLVSPSPSSMNDLELLLKAQVENEGAAQNVFWQASVKNLRGETVRSATGADGVPSGVNYREYILSVDDGLPIGEYGIELILLDANNQELARGGTRHEHGRSAITVEEASVGYEGPCVKPGQSLTLWAQVANRGELVEEGEIFAAVWHGESGRKVVQFSEPFVEMEPGKELVFTEEWKPEELAPGGYQAAFWVESEGGSTSQVSIDFETCRTMELLLVPDADAYTQCQEAFFMARAVCEGQTVPGATYGVEVTTPGGLSELCDLEEYPEGGRFFFFHFRPADGEGLYRFRGQAQAPGYKQAQSEATVLLSRNPAVLWPERFHVPCDGTSEVGLDLGPVYTDHGWHPLVNQWWDGRARHGFDPIFRTAWSATPPRGWQGAVENGVGLNLVPSGTMATVAATAGTILAPADADPAFPGHQVVLSGGTAHVTLRAPEAPAVVEITAEIPGVLSMAFTWIAFTSGDLNGDGEAFGVGDVLRDVHAAEWYPGPDDYLRELDPTADGSIDDQDVAFLCTRWTGGRAAGEKAPGNPEPGDCVAILRGQWDDALPGGAFSFQVDLRSRKPVRGLEVKLSYRPDILVIEGVDAGEWLGEDGDPILLGPVGNGGEIACGVLRSAPRDRGVHGEGKALVFHSSVLAAGDLGLVIEWARAVGPGGEPLRTAVSYVSSRPAAPTPFRRADANADGAVDLSDAITILRYLFVQSPLSCLSAGDADGNERLDIGDSIFLLYYLFAGGTVPPEPFQSCGVFPDTLGCERFPPCR